MSILSSKNEAPCESTNTTVNANPNTSAKSPLKRSAKAPQNTNDESERKSPRTPTRQSASASVLSGNDANIVTPSTSAVSYKKSKGKTGIASTSNARRSLTLDTLNEAASLPTVNESEECESKVSKKKLPFGGNSKSVEIPKHVRSVYHIVHKHTGSVGGNGHGGAIYGELTVGSMQKMVNLMMEHTNLDKESRFIDVGCGLGKPNLHVAQYPGVQFSYGIEMEHVRWMLGVANLSQVLKEAKRRLINNGESDIGHGVYFAHGDITEANYFDPFTHVYMFDIGFPPRLFHILSEMFNRSQSEFLICYHGPKLMIDTYEFNIELITQKPLSMHGSSEVHTGYIYRRCGSKVSKAKACKTKCFGAPCDPLFAKAWEVCESGIEGVCKHTEDEVDKHIAVASKRVTRSAARKSLAM